jgi:exo-beta-1,3-glucanase (GH17 family)
MEGRHPSMEHTMTETSEPKIITDALAVIDRGLSEMLHRELVSTDEVADLLLDVRTLLASADVEPVAG